MFHAKDGVYFGRTQEDGTVRVEVGDGRGTVIRSIELSADTWASVVAFVSARGETAETWREAREFHERR